MKRYAGIVAFLLASLTSLSQVTTVAALSDGAALLFRNTSSKLSSEEKNWFFNQMNFTLSKDKRHFMSGENEVVVRPYITDMNKDGKEEVFIVVESVALYGNTGQNFILYMRNDTGSFARGPALGGGIPMILIANNPGYPDIAVGGPGVEFPVYHWSGKEYRYLKKLKDADLQNGKIKYMELAECSKLYTDTLK